MRKGGWLLGSHHNSKQTYVFVKYFSVCFFLNAGLPPKKSEILVRDIFVTISL